MEPQAAYPTVERIMATDDTHDPTLASYQNGDHFQERA